MSMTQDDIRALVRKNRDEAYNKCIGYILHWRSKTADIDTARMLCDVLISHIQLVREQEHKRGTEADGHDKPTG